MKSNSLQQQKELSKEQEGFENQNGSFNDEDQILICEAQNISLLNLNEDNTLEIKQNQWSQEQQIQINYNQHQQNRLNNPQSHQEQQNQENNSISKRKNEDEYKDIAEEQENEEDESENQSQSKQNMITQESYQSNDQLEKQIRNHFMQSAVRALDIPYSDIQDSSLHYYIKDMDQKQFNSKQFDSPEEESETNEQEKDKNIEEQCYTHDKNIQGYCINEKQLLCIDCILSGNHKNHEICAIDKAAKIERDILTVKYQQSKIQKDLVEHTLFKNLNHQELLKNQSIEYLSKLKQLFVDVRVLIDEKEKQMVKDIDSKLQKELKHLTSREKEGKQKIQQISKFQESWHKIGQIDEIQFLQTLTQRQQEAEKALSETKAVKMNQSIPKFN